MNINFTTHDRAYDYSVMDAENRQRKIAGEASGYGWFEVTPEIVYYHYNEREVFDVASIVGPTIDGADYDSFVLLDYNRAGAPKCVAFIHSVDGLDRTEEDVCKLFHEEVEKYLMEVKR